MAMLQEIKNNVLAGKLIGKEEALALADAPLEDLCRAADEIRKFFCGDNFDLCTIINGKSGKCSEDCKYCAQSVFSHSKINEYPLLDAEKIVSMAKYNNERGVPRYSIVTSGKSVNDRELDVICESVKRIKNEIGMSVCVSLGLLSGEQFEKLKSAGVDRIHNNLETSRNYFPEICTTHSYDDKISAIKNAQKAGFFVCSGGLVGLGESMGDRIDMALELRNLGIRSVPVNMLDPIPGTACENSRILNEDEMRRIVAIFRFILPDAFIRLAGGRRLLDDNGRECFVSGANAVISGDMLTTSGISIQSDMKMIKELGYEVF
ncbi:MAG: bioB [Oscillospiraceae bacterium]|jgi:biotin synthase|nr:bioB [Oscillospiraceae bacterium]